MSNRGLSSLSLQLLIYSFGCKNSAMDYTFGFRRYDPDPRYRKWLYVNGFGGRKRFLWVSRPPPSSWIPCRHRLCQQLIFFFNSKTCLLISVRWIKFSSYNTYCIKKGTNALYVRHKKKIRKTTCLYYIRWISKVIQERFVCSIYFPFLYSTYPISFATPIF